MVKKIITWVDLQGRYRVTSPAYHDWETEDECLERVWARMVAVGGYGIPIDHPHHYVEDTDQRERLATCCGNSFRYGVTSHGPHGNCDARDGAWEMDTDGRPKVNMPKARGVHMDTIRAVRNAELVKLDLTSLRAIEAGDTDAQATISTEKDTLRNIPQTFDLTTDNDTPIELQAKWPSELPARE
jgi:hypothetical protein